MKFKEWPSKAWLEAVKGLIVVYVLNGQIVGRTIGKPSKAAQTQSRRG